MTGSQTFEDRTSISYTLPNGVHKTLWIPVDSGEHELFVPFFFTAVVHFGTFACIPPGSDDAHHAVVVIKYNPQTKIREKAYLFLDDENWGRVGSLTPEFEKTLHEAACSAAATLYEEFHTSFDDPNYFENAGMAAWGVVQEKFPYTISWRDAQDVEHAELREWHKLSFPDGSVLFVHPGVGCSLVLSPEFEAQHQASLALKDGQHPPAFEDNIPQDVLMMLANISTSGRAN